MLTERVRGVGKVTVRSVRVGRERERGRGRPWKSESASAVSLVVSKSCEMRWMREWE